MIVKRCSITTLKVDVIVNAANPSGLGCFRSDHNCIDNVIHREAGQLLHEECKQIMKGGKLHSYPIITKGYNLSCKNIMHVVGPQIIDKITEYAIIHLWLLYQLSNRGSKNKAKTIAFPCISTGLYRFDNSMACDIAYNAVSTFLSDNSDIDLTVIFNVFTDLDERLYRKKLNLD